MKPSYYENKTPSNRIDNKAGIGNAGIQQIPTAARLASIASEGLEDYKQQQGFGQ